MRRLAGIAGAAVVLALGAGSAFSLDGVSTREFGHVIGLCHVNAPSALMDPSFDVCESKSKGSDENAGESAIHNCR